MATREDIFYTEKLSAYKNLHTEIFLSKEQREGYQYGRIDISQKQFPLETEFYLCGNTAMVTEQMKLLKARGYTSIYAEIF
ncbi:MAG: hypothetical protein WCJ39_04285 [bacterium]